MAPTVFKNCNILRGGKVTENAHFSISSDGNIVDQAPSDADVIELDGKIVAPGFIELQTNGMRGFHFTHFDDAASYAKKVDEVARYLVSQGVTAFYATIPTVSSEEFKRVSLYWLTCIRRALQLLTMRQ